MLTINRKHLEIFMIILFLLFIISSLDVSFATKSNENSINNINSINSINRAYNTKYSIPIINIINIDRNDNLNGILRYVKNNNPQNKNVKKANSKSASKNKINTLSRTKTKTKTKIKVKSKLEDGCCSIILHVNQSSYVYGYRRDSTYAANLYVKKVKLYGIEALKEHKTTNTYFFHSMIFKNGWYVGAGGSDNHSVNRYLENLGAKMVYKKTISTYYMKKAMKKVRSLGLGHFVIKSPEGKVGVAIYNRGSSKLSIFRMKSGEYLSIPNSPRLFRKGIYTVRKSNPVNAAIYIAGTDKFGVNRRNIMIYDVTNTNSIIKTIKKSTNKTVSKNITKTKIKIWTSNDNGRYVGRNTGKTADNIIFRGEKISAISIPKIPCKKYVGEVILN